MSGHRIEVSPNNRAVCKATECKKNGIKIQKGQMRYGTFITARDFQSWAWKHWGCVTPKQISNLKDSTEGDASQLDGYEELPEDLQEKVATAIEQGHIADEDWIWDIEMNRPGQNGYFTPETKRRLKAEAQAEKGEAAGEENASPSKTNKKKRGHIKDDPDEEEPPAKKTKARAKKEKKIKNEDTDGGPEDEGPAIKTEHEIKKEPKIKNEDSHGDGGSENEGPAIKTELSVKKESKIKNEDADEGSGNEGPTTKKAKPRVKREPKVKNEDADGNSENGGPSTRKNISRVGNEPKTNEDASTRSDIQEPVKKATRASTKKGKKVVADEADGDLDHVAQPVQKGRKRVKKAAAEDEAVLDVKDENSDHQILQPRRLRAPRKAAMASKIKDESTETDASDSASEFDREPSEDALESQMTRKKATKKAVNGKAKVKKGSKPKGKTAAARA